MDVSVIRNAVVGGALIGGAAGGLFLLEGRIAGISGIVARWLAEDNLHLSWRGWFVAGLLVGGNLVAVVSPTSIGTSPASLPLVLLAGLLVGFGARVGNGCTSGHGVCGIARRSPRSLAATLTFMSTGFGTVYALRHLAEWP